MGKLGSRLWNRTAWLKGTSDINDQSSLDGRDTLVLPLRIWSSVATTRRDLPVDV